MLSFFKGSLLKDPQGILTKPGENSRAARVIRFASVQDIERVERTLMAYINEAINVEKAGLKVDFAQDAELPIPEEFQEQLDEMPALQEAFDALTPGRQRAYLLHFAGAKQSKSRADRVRKCTPRILDGKGLNDCVCGLSKRLPACDGSHKSIG